MSTNFVDPALVNNMIAEITVKVNADVAAGQRRYDYGVIVLAHLKRMGLAAGPGERDPDPPPP